VVSKLEILCGDLAGVPYRPSAGRADYRFDTRIAQLEQSRNGVEVALSDGTRLHADLVVGADGPHLWFTKADAIDLPDYKALSVLDVGNGDQCAL
jgi:hypothetical protein